MANLEERINAFGFSAAQAEAILCELNSDRKEIVNLYGEVRDFITMHATGDDAAEAGDLLRRLLVLKGHYSGLTD